MSSVNLKSFLFTVPRGGEEAVPRRAAAVRDEAPAAVGGVEGHRQLGCQRVGTASGMDEFASI